jgi:hypothetical protein
VANGAQEVRPSGPPIRAEGAPWKATVP